VSGICGLAWSLCGVVASFVGAACASASAFLIGLGARKSFVDIIRERCHDGRIQGLARRAGAEARLEEPMSGSDLDRVVEQYHRALDAFVRGDPELQKKLFSRRDDVSLANPLGLPARGWSAVEQTMERAVSQLREGEPINFERISGYVGTELAYTVEIERARAKVGGSDEVSPISLRVTTIFRLEDGQWKVLHRHADPITSPRPIESIVQV